MKNFVSDLFVWLIDLVFCHSYLSHDASLLAYYTIKKDGVCVSANWRCFCCTSGYPHLESPSRLKWNEAQKLRPVWDFQNGTLSCEASQGHSCRLAVVQTYGRVDALFVQLRNWLTAEFPNHSSVPLCDNREDDDSKLWIDRSNSKDSSS
jgi:hypothetical protein